MAVILSNQIFSTVEELIESKMTECIVPLDGHDTIYFLHNHTFPITIDKVIFDKEHCNHWINTTFVEMELEFFETGIYISITQLPSITQFASHNFIHHPSNTTNKLKRRHTITKFSDVVSSPPMKRQYVEYTEYTERTPTNLIKQLKKCHVTDESQFCED
jgi:hypothetical protein